MGTSCLGEQIAPLENNTTTSKFQLPRFGDLNCRYKSYANSQDITIRGWLSVCYLKRETWLDLSLDS